MREPEGTGDRGINVCRYGQASFHSPGWMLPLLMQDTVLGKKLILSYLTPKSLSKPLGIGAS